MQPEKQAEIRPPRGNGKGQEGEEITEDMNSTSSRGCSASLSLPSNVVLEPTHDKAAAPEQSDRKQGKVRRSQAKRPSEVLVLEQNSLDGEFTWIVLECRTKLQLLVRAPCCSTLVHPSLRKPTERTELQESLVKRHHQKYTTNASIPQEDNGALVDCWRCLQIRLGHFDTSTDMLLRVA